MLRFSTMVERPVLFCVTFLTFIIGIATASWKVKHQYTFGSRQQIENNWKIMKWHPGFVNNELQEYTDSEANLFTQNNKMVIRAYRQDSRCSDHSNKDISGNDLKNFNGKAEGECCGLCASTSGCRAYSWNSYKGGTCWLKKGTGPLKDAAGVSSGIMSSGSGTCSTLDKKDVAPGNNLKSVSHKRRGDCCSICKQTSNCRAYAWNSYNGGTCWLKSVSSPVMDKPGVYSGILGNGGIVSARVESKLSFNAQKMSGKRMRIEFTGTVPAVKGAWPAYWALGDGRKYGAWPYEGEIDVMEWVYQLHQPNRVANVLHWEHLPAQWQRQRQLDRNRIKREMFTYGVEVSAVPHNEYIQFYVKEPNGHTSYGDKATPSVWKSSFKKCPTFTAGASKCSNLAPFDNDFYLIINLAVGGNWGGCCGVNGDYSAFDGRGIDMTVERVVVHEGA